MPHVSRQTLFGVFVASALISVITGFVGVRMADDEPSRVQVMVFVLNVSYWALWTLLTPAVLYLGSRYRFVEGRRAQALAVHAVGGIVFAATHVGLLHGASALARAAIMGVPVSSAWNGIGVPGRMHIEWEVTTYWALVGLAHALAFSRDAHQRALSAAGLEAQLARAQLQVLQQQLHPHFLFNTLQSLSALIHRDPLTADRMVERLADLLRLTLSAGNAAEVPLRQDLEHTRHYLEIEQVNMGARLRTAIDVAPDALDCLVPALLLQPLAENAVRHGLAPRAAGGTVTIRGHRHADTLELSVVDDGVGLGGGRASRGIGIDNTRQRLAQLYGERQAFELRPNPTGGVVVTIQLPFRRAVAGEQRAMAAWRT